jgi:hypothetical protein
MSVEHHLDRFRQVRSGGGGGGSDDDDEGPFSAEKCIPDLPHVVPGVRKSRSYTSSPPERPHDM